LQVITNKTLNVVTFSNCFVISFLFAVIMFYIPSKLSRRFVFFLGVGTRFVCK